MQAAGTAEKMAVEVRKLGGEQWGATWVRYGIGRGGGVRGEEQFDFGFRQRVAMAVVAKWWQPKRTPNT